MADEKNWQEELENSDLFKQAKEAGIDLNAYTAKSETEMVNALAKIKESMSTQKEGNATPETDKEKSDDKKETKEKTNTATKTEEGNTLTVNGEEKEEPAGDNWIEAKRALWEKFAAERSMTYSEDDRNNASKTSLEFGLTLKNQEQGKIKYSSPNNVQISPDSAFSLYQGVVKDAITNNMSITFGSSLSGSQQLLLYAAALTSPGYKNDDKVELVNPPALTPTILKSDDFVNLPQELQIVLKKEANRLESLKKIKEKTPEELAAEAKAEEIQAKLSSLKEKLNKNGGEAWTKLSSGDLQERQALRQEQIALKRETLSPEEVEKRKNKELEREKIMAARLGFGDFKTTYNADVKNEKGEIIHHKGDERIVTKDEALIADKSRVSDEVRQALKTKYGSRE